MGSQTTRPEIAVVISTFNRARRLEALVGSLLDQDVQRPYEIVIVDNASRDRTKAELDRLAAASTVPFRVLRLASNRGPARARNLGWRHAAADRIAFTDDDCSPEPGWLRALNGRLDDVEIVQGRVAPHPAQSHRIGPFSRSVTVGGENGFYETCNIAYRRSVLDALDGFDERLQQAGEDTDLGCRARAMGATYAFESEALVYHDVVDQGFVGYLRNTRRWAGVVEMVHLHPELRRFFTRGPFWLRSHSLAALGVAGLGVAATGLGLSAAGHSRGVFAIGGAVLVAPYVRYRRRATPPPGSGPLGRRHLALAFVGDAAEALTHVCAQLRVALVPRGE